MSGSEALLEKAYKSSGGRMWICARESGRIFGAYTRGPESTKALAQRLGVTSESIANWARAGWLRTACRGLTHVDESGKTWTFLDLRRALSFVHFIVAGKVLVRELFGPSELVEWLVICATEGKSGEWLAANLIPVNSDLWLKRWSALERTSLPDDWTPNKKNAVELWLDAGRELMT